MEVLKPHTIYKYSSIEAAKQIIQNGTLKFTNPSDFNDPFDCDIDLLDFKNEGKVSSRVSKEIETLREQFPVESKNLDWWVSIYKPVVQQKINSTTICCFSLVNNNIQMWSHYSEKHQGVCFEFDNTFEKRFLDLDEEDDISAGVMNYHFRGRINYLTEDRTFSIAWLFLNKAKEWEYEKEYRLMLLNRKDAYQKFYPKFLRAVYFGVKVADEQRKEFVEFCMQRNFEHLTFYKGRKHNLTIRFEEL